MISSFKPSVAQSERLELLIEECAEVIHAATKILRHGYNSHHPDTQEVNRDALRRELLDLITVVNLIAFDAGANFTDEEVRDARERKLKHTYAQ